MPTLLELFKTNQLPSQGGKTAEEAYDIQNSKDIRISTSDPLVNNTGFAGANLLRKTLGVRGSETLLEQEVVGTRIIRGLSLPVIYGSDLPRLTLRTTPLLDVMKAGTKGDLGGGGTLGNAIADARDFVNDTLKITSNIIPTKIYNDNRIKSKGETQNRMILLADIKGSPSDKLLAELLKGGIGGNLKTIGKQAIGGIINLAKDKIRGKLFGERSKTGFNQGKAGPGKNASNISTNYGSLDNLLYATIKTDPNTGITDVGGLMYSKTFNLTFRDDDEPGKLNFIDSSEEGGLASKTPEVVKRRFTVPAIMNLPAGEYEYPLYSDLYNTIKRNDINDAVNTDGTLKDTEVAGFKTIEEAKEEGEENSAIFGENGVDKFPDKIELTIDRNRISADPDRIGKTIISKQKIDTKSDGVNQLKVGEEDDTLDFAALKFKSIPTGKTIQFRATINGLSETLSPSWDSNKFVGNPFSYHTYTGIERSVSFNFKIFSLNKDEHKIGWDKLNFLTSLVYPQSYFSNSSVAPPFIQFTLGDLYKNKYSFIDSLSYTFEDSTPWEIEEKNYRLPMIIDVAVGLKFLESRGNTAGKKFYSFQPTT